jgi:hypothetical protein
MIMQQWHWHLHHLLELGPANKRYTCPLCFGVFRWLHAPCTMQDACSIEERAEASGHLNAPVAQDKVGLLICTCFNLLVLQEKS